MSNERINAETQVQHEEKSFRGLELLKKTIKKTNLAIINISPLVIGMFIIIKSYAISQIITYGDSEILTIRGMFNYSLEMLFIPHLAFVMIIMSVGFLFKDKLRTYVLIIIDALVSILFVADLNYYRATNDFLKLKHLLNPSLFNPLDHSVFNFKGYDVLFFVDIILILILTIINKKECFKAKRRIMYCPIILVLSLLTIHKYHNIIDVYKGTKSPERFIYQEWYQRASINSESVLGYHLTDIVTTLNDKRIQYSLRKQGMDNVTEWINNNKEDIEDNEYKGIFEGKNLVFIQVESLDEMVLNNTIKGQEVTPNMNKLLKNSLHFKNIYVQNGEGMSSDSDFMINTGVLPIQYTKMLFRYQDNKFTSIASLLEDKDYTTMSSHPDTSPFLSGFNWAENHTSAFGYDNVYDATMLEADEIIYLGLSDEEYLKAVKEKMNDLKQPFFNYSITLTSHGNYTVLPDDKKYLDLPDDLNETVLGCYFQNFRYTDEQIGKFIESVENDEDMKDTVFVIFGDHNGLRDDYKKEFYESNVKIDETWWEDDENRIPLIVYSPGFEGKEIETYGGQIDILPTIAYLMGVDRSKFEDSVMGRVLVNTNRNATIQSEKTKDGELVIKGEVKNSEEDEHLRNAYNIAEKYIKSNYVDFMNKK